MASHRTTISQVVSVIVLCGLMGTVAGMRCYECNVWKAGYGNLCEQPRIRDGCVTCMKIETTVFMGFYKNTPRTSTVISRTCAQSKAVPHLTGCYYYQMADGHSTRCYCNHEMCNGATRQQVYSSTVTSSALALGALLVARGLLFS